VDVPSPIERCEILDRTNDAIPDARPAATCMERLKTGADPSQGQSTRRRAKFFALPIRGVSPIRPFAHSPTRPLHSLGLKQTVWSMEVDFQAIKVEELKSRLGELRRFL